VDGSENKTNKHVEPRPLITKHHAEADFVGGRNWLKKKKKPSGYVKIAIENDHL